MLFNLISMKELVSRRCRIHHEAQGHLLEPLGCWLDRRVQKKELCHQRVCSHEGLFSMKMNPAPPLHSSPFQNFVPGVYLNRLKKKIKKKERRKELTIKGVVDSPSFFLGQCIIVTVDIEDTFQCVRCPSVRTLLRRSLESKGGNLPSCGLGGRW